MTGEGAVASGSGTAVSGSSTAEDWLCSGVLGIISSAAGTETKGTAPNVTFNAVHSLLGDQLIAMEVRFVCRKRECRRLCDNKAIAAQDCRGPHVVEHCLWPILFPQNCICSCDDVEGTIAQ